MADDTTYKVEIDISDAEQQLDKLDGKAENCRERMERIGDTGSSIGDGIAGGAGQGMDSLNVLGGAANSAGNAISGAGSAGAAAGRQISGAMDGAANSTGTLDTALDGAQTTADNLGKVGEDTGGRIRKAFDNAAAASDGMGVSFAKNFNKATQAGKSFSSSMKTGITGAFDTARKKVSSFVGDTVGGVKKVGNAFLHPIQTIKGKFSSAMKDAAKDTGKVGDEAKASEKDLDSMGKSGASAGEKMQKGLGSALKVIGAIAAAAVVVVGLTKFVGAALEASKAAENISYSFDKTFGDSAPDVEGWANNFAGAVHRSSSEVKNFLTSNRQLYESMGITGEAANDLSKATTSLAFDIGNKFGIEDSEALSQLQDAISGNADALKAYGVKLDDTALKASAMAMGLGSNLDALDDAAMAQVRFNAIMEQTGDIQQNASKSLGGFTGGVKSVKAAWTDFLEKAGAKLAPAFDKIFGAVLDAWPKVEPALLSFVDLLADGFAQAAPILADFATNLLPQLLGLASELLPMLMEVGGELLPVISQVLGTVVQAIGPLMPLIGTLIKTLLPPLAQLFGTLVEKLLPPLASLLGALSPVIEALSPVLEIAAGAIGLVAEAIAGLIGWLTQGIEKIGEFASGLKDTAVGNFVSGIGDGIKGAASSVKNFFGGNAKGTDDFEGGWTHVNEAGGELIHNKNESGLAFLPKGSAIIPASKTDEILSGEQSPGGKIINITNLLQGKQSEGDVGSGLLGAGASALRGVRDWIPTLIENAPLLNKATFPGNEDKPDGDGNPKPPSPPPPTGDSPDSTSPPPSPDSAGAGGEQVVRYILDWNITVSSDGTVPPEVLEEFERLAERVSKKVVRQDKDDELDALGIQRGVS